MSVNYTPFTCYFCNKTLRNETQEGHLATCGLVLEPCPNKCGAYIQRIEREKHMRKCKNNFYRRSTSIIDSADNFSGTSYRNGTITSNVSSRTLQSNPQQSNELIGLNYRIANVETILNQLSGNLNQLKLSTQNTNTHNPCREKLNHVSTNLDRAHQSLAQLNTLQHRNEQQISSVKHAIVQLTNENRQDLSNIAQSTNKYKINLENLEQGLASHRKEFVSEQINSRETCNDIRADLNEFKDFYAQENATVGALWSEQMGKIGKLEERVSEVNGRLDELNAVYVSVNFDVRTVMRIATENADRLEGQEKDVRYLKEGMAQIRLDLEAIEDIQSTMRGFSTGPPGRLIWKITDFASKMEMAKEKNTVLKSPIFYTWHYGYKVRLIVYLNGIKKWKGRHLIACLHVLKSDYDDLIKWPCFIEGNVILKDIHSREEKNHIKYISAKREYGDEEGEEPQESSTQYIFIPHTTLLKETYIKENTIYLEVDILKSERHETTI